MTVGEFIEKVKNHCGVRIRVSSFVITNDENEQYNDFSDSNSEEVTFDLSMMEFITMLSVFKKTKKLKTSRGTRITSRRITNDGR
jgi:hypothetical protein